MFRLDSERALVVTTDFFPPIVDDPRWFGRIAAANALSDVFAMGGEALTALNIVGWPDALPIEMLGEVLAGGLDKVQEAGAALCGGHSVRDQEVKYGLAVTGEVHPDRFWSNAGARQGDVLILTKPVGMGIVSTAIKQGKLEGRDDLLERAMVQMATLNLGASRAVIDLDVHAATDVTGFGLVGHGREMADGAGLSLAIDTAAVPVFDGAGELADAGLCSGGGKKSRVTLGPVVDIAPGIEESILRMLFDAETSGGLLIAVSETDADQALRRLGDAGTPCVAEIGRFVAREERAILLR